MTFGGVTMRISPKRWRPEDLVAGNPALDFVNTVDGWRRREPVDTLGDAAAFGGWAAAADLLDAEDLASLEAEIARDEQGAALFYKDAKKLRAALWRIFSAAAEGSDVDAKDLDLLTRLKVRAARHCRLVHENGRFRRRCTEEAPSQERALRLIVEAAEDLLLNGRLERLHVCGGGNCEWLFLDTSKNGRRRWCSMATCGNDAKVKKYRTRKKRAA